MCWGPWELYVKHDHGATDILINSVGLLVYSGMCVVESLHISPPDDDTDCLAVDSSNRRQLQAT
jgi:hypothetical protein